MKHNYSVHQGTKFTLLDDCDTLVTKLENQIDDMYFGVVPYDEDKAIELENDLEELRKAIGRYDQVRMYQILYKYHNWFKRYREAAEIVTPPMKLYNLREA